MRCCIDYRLLNSVTRKDAYFLPRTDYCLEALSAACWFSAFDLRSGNHQVARDADKAAFVGRRDQFLHRTTPMGLCNDGATFQRLMDLILAGLIFEVCLVYLDDVIVFSTSLDQHLERLRLVLEQIRNCGLKLKTSKCSFMQKSVSFLGHVVSGDGITTDHEKVCLLRDHSFIHSYSFIKQFVRTQTAIFKKQE
jgi:Reverse transcriptase (RNA-dependent DNA polymerase)